MINTTVENIIRYEVCRIGAKIALFETKNRLEAYEYYHKVSKTCGLAFVIRKVTINTTTEVLEGE